MKILTIYSDTHQQLYNDFFIKSINKFMPKANVISKKIQQMGSGEYESEGFDLTMFEKIKFIIDCIDTNDNELMCYSDCDVQFFGEPNFNADLFENDISFQMDNENTYCAGFFIFRQTEKVRQFFQQVLKEFQLRLNGKIHDQIIINILIRNNQTFGLSIGKLNDSKYWTIANEVGGVWKGDNKFEIPKDIIVHHANWVIGVANKISLMELVRYKKGYGNNYIELDAERMFGQGDYIVDGMKVNKLFGLCELCQKYLTSQSRVLELGVNDGVSTELFAQYASEVVAIDITKTKRLKERLERISNITFKQMYFKDFLSDEKFDFIYIDGDHSYKSIIEDIEIAKKYIKPNGVIAGHDFNSETPGVKIAVTEIFGNNIELYNDSSWAFKINTEQNFNDENNSINTNT